MKAFILVHIETRVNGKLDGLAVMHQDSAGLTHLYHEHDFDNYNDFIEQARTDADNANVEIYIQ